MDIVEIFIIVPKYFPNINKKVKTLKGKSKSHQIANFLIW